MFCFSFTLTELLRDRKCYNYANEVQKRAQRLIRRIRKGNTLLAF